MERVGMHRACLVVILMALATKESFAIHHVVGGNQGWDVSSDFSSWASLRTFKVGDQLVFKYTSGLHSVVELGKESAYKNCDIGSAVDSMNGGNDVVKLDKAGTRYFACGTLGHCDQGMKLKIKIVAAVDDSSSPQSPSSSSTPTLPSSSFNCTSPSSSSSSTPTSISAASSLNHYASYVLLIITATIALCNMV